MALENLIEDAAKDKKVEELTAKDYFDALKKAKEELTDGDIKKLAESAQFLSSRAMITGQTDMMKNMAFVLQNIERMIELKKLGVSSYVMRADIERFTKLVKDKSVYIVELEKFKRVIPDDVIDTIAKVKHLFDVMYIVYTDYSSESKKEHKKKVIEKDPIVFGAFRNVEDKLNYDRMFYIADWVDEYCQLTLSELINELAANGYKGVKKNITEADTPITVDGLRKVINENTLKKNGGK